MLRDSRQRLTDCPSATLGVDRLAQLDPRDRAMLELAASRLGLGRCRALELAVAEGDRRGLPVAEPVVPPRAAGELWI